MDPQNTSVILHTYQHQLLPPLPPTDVYNLAPPTEFVGNPNFITHSNWGASNSSFSNYPEPHFGSNEISSLTYSNVYDDFSKETSSMSVPSLHNGSNSSSSTSDVGSSVDCSISPEPILMPSVKRGRPTENPCWAYFHRIDDQLVKCRLCTKMVRSACATNMTKHLERHHLEDFEKVCGQLKLCRTNDTSIRQKMIYQMPPETNPLTTIPAVPNSYLESIPKIEQFDSGQYYSVDEQQTVSGQQFVQFDQSQETANWSFYNTGHLGEPSTSSLGIGTSVIQTVTGKDEMGQQTSQTQQNPSQIVFKPNQVKPNAGREKPYMKRNRKTEHPVWEFFKRTSDGNAECIICQGVVKSPCSSNFMRHLMRHHSNEYNGVYLKWLEKRSVTHPGVQYTSVPPPAQHVDC